MTAILDEAIRPLASGRTPESAGRGRIELSQVNGRTAVTRASATSPLKLLTPRSRPPAAWVFTSTYGGGLLGGDEISLDIRAGSNTRGVITTQASTKIYRTEGAVSRQELDVVVEDEAILVWAPDPLACFSGAKFDQRQQFELKGSSGLVMVDWFTSGRRACGERWKFGQYSSRTEIRVEQRPIFRDTIRLDPSDGPLAGPMRMGRCDCFATIAIAGPALKESADAIARQISATTSDPQEELITCVSPLESGCIVRIAAVETESVGRWIRSRLSFLSQWIGGDPWLRKW